MVCVNPRPQQFMIPDRKARRAPYPYILLCRIPADKCFVIRQGVETVEMFHLYAEPFELCPHHHELSSPRFCGLLHAWENRFFVYELDGKLLHVYFSPICKVHKKLRYAQAVLSAAERKEYRESIPEHILDPDLCGLHHVDAGFLSFYSHMRSPHFGQITNLPVSAGSCLTPASLPL